MRGSSMFSVLVWGLSSVNAIPYQSDTLNSRDISSLERRAKPAAPVTIMADKQSCLNVPQTYAAFMDATTGAWDRYQCDSDKLINSADKITAVKDRQMATHELIVCMDINLISKGGVIKAHIPPTICPLLKGYRGTEKASKGATGDYNLLKSAMTKLLKDHGAKMGGFLTVVVHGPYKGFTDEATKQALADLFTANVKPFAQLQSKSTSDKGGYTRVDLSPPALFIDGVDAKIHFP